MLMTRERPRAGCVRGTLKNAGPGALNHSHLDEVVINVRIDLDGNPETTWEVAGSFSASRLALRVGVRRAGVEDQAVLFHSHQVSLDRSHRRWGLRHPGLEAEG